MTSHTSSFSPRAITVAFLLLLAGTRALAQGVLELPGPLSVQSGIGLVTGYVCEAERVEVAFNRGVRLLVPHGSTRADTERACGREDTGFGFLWNYNLLEDGEHVVELFVDGKRIAERVFTVTTLGAQFLRDVNGDVRVNGFPTPSTDVILQWQQANQNFVISDYLPSRDSYDVTGFWALPLSSPDFFDIELMVSPSPVSPSESLVSSVVFSDDLVGALSGVLNEDFMVLVASTEFGDPFEILATMEFFGERKATFTFLECDPVDACEALLDRPLVLEKYFPLDENDFVAEPGDGGIVLTGQAGSPRSTMHERALQARRTMSGLRGAR